MDDACAFCPDWNAYVGPARYGRLFVDNHDTAPREIGPVFLTREEGARPAHGLWGVPHSGPNISFQSLLLPNRTYSITLNGPAPDALRLTLRFRPPGEWVQLTLPYAGSPPFIFRDRKREQALAAAPTLAAMQAAQGSAYFLAHGKLTVRLVMRGHDANGTTSLDVCRTSACP